MRGEPLPGQSEEISLELKQLLKRVRRESAREIIFKIGSVKSEFEGRAECLANKIILEIKPGLGNSVAEYIVAHELGHVIQFIRGFAIAGGRIEEPEAILIATEISDFVFDSMADSLANQYGFPIASGFNDYYRSSDMLDVLNKPSDSRHFGTKWERIWEHLTEARVCRMLGNRIPRLPREYRTLIVALDFANIIKRAINLNLKIGVETKATISRQHIISQVIDDLLNMDANNKTKDIDGCISELNAMFYYLKLKPGHIQIHKPLTGEILVEGLWRPVPKINKTSTLNLVDFTDCNL